MLSYICIHIVTRANTNTPTENDTLTTAAADETQNSLHRTSNEDLGIIRTNTTIEL